MIGLVYTIQEMRSDVGRWLLALNPMACKMGCEELEVALGVRSLIRPVVEGFRAVAGMCRCAMLHVPPSRLGHRKSCHTAPCMGLISLVPAASVPYTAWHYLHSRSSI
jgi:hypothetical protein